MPIPPAASRSRLTAIGYGAGLVVLLLIGYASIWSAGFIWDDDLHLTAHPCVVGPLGLKEAWTTPEANYFPLVLTHFWVLYKIVGLNATVYHGINLLLHFANTLLLWRVLRRLRISGAWIAAALWSVHPVMVESVAWISEYTNTQSCFFFLLSLRGFLKWLAADESDDRRWRDYAVALICAAAAMLSKPSTVMLPAVFVLCWWWLRRPWRMKQLVWLIPFFAFAGGWSGWTVWEQRVHSGASGYEWDLSLLPRAIVAGCDVCFYLGKLAWPDPLIFVYRRWRVDPADPVVYLPLIALVGVAVWLIRRRATMRGLIFAGAAFVLLLFPVLGFFNVYYFRFSFVADHFQYLASIAPFALVGAVISRIALGEQSTLTASRALRPITAIVSGALLCLLTSLTFFHAREFVNDETLWRATLAKNPTCWMAHNNLGQLVAQRPGGKPEAMAHYREALRLKPDFVDANSNLGNEIALASDDFATAIAYLERALHDDPKFAAAHINLANVLARIPGRSGEAIAHYETALELKPDSMIAHSNLASELAKQPGRFADAVAHYRAALRLDPNNADVHYNLGNCLFNRPEHRAESIPEFEAAVRSRPKYGQAEFNLATAIFVTSGDMAKALPHFETALAILPDNADARYNFAGLLGRDPRFIDRAISEYEKVIQLAPNYLAAHNDVAVMYARTGNYAAAVQHLETAVRLAPNDVTARQNLETVKAQLQKQ